MKKRSHASGASLLISTRRPGGGRRLALDSHSAELFLAEGLGDRLGVGGPAGRVLVPAAAALAAQVPGGHALRHQRRRPPARLAERLLVEGARDGEPDVEPDEVHQLERAHAEAAGHAADAVDLLGRGDPVLDGPQRLEAERAVAAVDDEARAVGGVDHVLAHRLAGLARDGERVRARLLAGHDLDQPHLGRRVEEVHADHARGVREAGGERGHAQRRRVGGQHAVGLDHLGQAGEQRALELEVLRRGLDHEPALRQRIEVAHRLDALGRPRERLAVGVVEQRAQARLGGERGDPGAHRPRAGDADGSHASALIPVSARPMISFWICEVPS